MAEGIQPDREGGTDSTWCGDLLDSLETPTLEIFKESSSQGWNPDPSLVRARMERPTEASPPRSPSSTNADEDVETSSDIFGLGLTCGAHRM